MAQQLNQLVTGLPPMAAACGLCGDLIHSFATTQVSEIVYHNMPNVFSEGNPWIYGRSADLDNIHFEELWVWASVFRAVVCRHDRGLPIFRLSGVGELRELQRMSLPDDEKEMALFNHRDYVQHVPAPPTVFTVWEDPTAFTMHERCWQLMTRILNPELIRQNMETFIRAMCDPWLDQHQRPLCHLGNTFPKARKWRGFICRLAKEYHRSTRSFFSLSVGDPGRLERHFSGADPLNDPYLQSVISKYTIKYTEQKKQEVDNTSKPSTSTHPMSRRSQSSFHLSHVFLPAELVLLIADCLEHHQDILAMVSVFPHWYPMIPNSYLRRRFIDENCLKNENLPAADALDWQHVYLNSDKLLRPSLGWRNRQHILKQLRKTKDRFMKSLEENDTSD